MGRPITLLPAQFRGLNLKYFLPDSFSAGKFLPADRAHYRYEDHPQHGLAPKEFSGSFSRIA